MPENITSREPKRLYIRADVELRKYGFTPRCPGCEAAGRIVRRDHNETRRKRMEGLMSQRGDAGIDWYAHRVADEAERLVRKMMANCEHENQYHSWPAERT